VSREKGWAPSRWREEDQMSPENDWRIWGAVMKARGQGAKPPPPGGGERSSIHFRNRATPQ
jgi:hypothetical protein